jgi:hypothetical protein
MVRAGVASAALAALSACDGADRTVRDLCIATLPALEEGDGPILVLSAEAIGRTGEAVRLRWRSGAGRDVHDHETACAFAEDPTVPGGRALVGLRTEQGDLPPARLFVLGRFWLADARLRAAGLARVTLAAELR